MVQWKGKPYTLQAPAKVECCGDGDTGAPEMPAGTLVCKAIYWDRIGQAPGWYEHPLSSPSKPPTTYLFWLNHVLCGNIQLKSGSITKKPGRGALISNVNKLAPYKLKLVNKQWMDELKFENAVREKVEHVPVVVVDEEVEVTTADEVNNDRFNEQESDRRAHPIEITYVSLHLFNWLIVDFMVSSQAIFISYHPTILPQLLSQRRNQMSRHVSCCWIFEMTKLATQRCRG
jgi:hypothetical protein